MSVRAKFRLNHISQQMSKYVHRPTEVEAFQVDDNTDKDIGFRVQKGSWVVNQPSSELEVYQAFSEQEVYQVYTDAAFKELFEPANQAVKEEK